jgi:eukaryotic-like serine/threonine-protein kinase
MENQPSQIGPYRVDGELGRGGMGVVYLGHDLRLERPVAIKALPEEFAKEPERLARFEREAKILASLNHPNVGGIYGLEEKGDAKYLILEYVEGDTLADRLMTGPLPLEDAIEICRQVALGIEAAHEAGVVHRDLKPGNIKITSEGQVKVLDFGLAKSPGMDPPSGPDLAQSPTLTYGATRDGIVLGTAGYMSPEQARGRRVDRRTDIWALGCVLFEMLTGKQAFQGDTISDTLAAVLRGEPDWDALPAGTPEPIRRLLHRCLEKDPRHRMRDAADAVLDLDEALKGPRPAAVAPAIVAGRPSRLWTLGIWGAIALLSLAAGWGLGRFMAGRSAKGGNGQRPLMVSIEIARSVKFKGGAMSPDGQALACVAEVKLEGKEGTTGNPKVQTRIILRRLDDYVPLHLKGTEGARAVFFSPDGRWLGFLATVSSESNKLRIMKLPADGSAPPVAVADWQDGWQDVSWLPDGDLFIVTAEVGKFVRVSPSGTGSPKTIQVAENIPGTVRYQAPRGIAGSPLVLLSRVAYAARGFQMDAVVYDPVAGTIKTLIEDAGFADYVPPGYLLFSRGDTLLAVRFDLARRAVTGGPVAVMGGLRTENNWSPGGYGYSSGILAFAPGGKLGDQRRLALSGPLGTVPWSQERRAYNGQLAATLDGKRVAVGITRAEGLDELWVSDSGGSVLRRLLFSSDSDVDYPVWSDDGKKLAYFRSSRNDKDGIYWVRMDRPDQPFPLVNANANKVLCTPCAWTPDGRSLIYVRRDLALGKAQLMSIEVPEDGGAAPAPRVFLEAGTSIALASFSPDGRLFAFNSNVSGLSQVYVCTYGADGRLGPPVPVSPGTALHGLWGLDSRSIAYVGEDGNVYRVELTLKDGIQASAPAEVLDGDSVGLVSPIDGLELLADGRYLLVQRGEGEGDVTALRVALNFDKVIQAKVPKRD